MQIKSKLLAVASAATMALMSVPAMAELLTVPFNQVDGAITQGLYSGLVNITVSGIGQSDGTTFNDAFYLLPGGTLAPNQTGYYQLGFGTTTLTPLNQSEAAFNYIVGGRPAFNGLTNTYSFVLNTGLTTPGKLHFNVTDGQYSDNTGSFLLSVSSVPEPATWAMMIVGVGAIGFAMRRRNVTTRVQFA